MDVPRWPGHLIMATLGSVLARDLAPLKRTQDLWPSRNDLWNGAV